MYVLTKVRDSDLLTQLTSHLAEKNITFHIARDLEDPDLYVVTVEDQQSLHQAYDIVRYYSGLSREFEIPKEVEKIWQLPRGQLTTLLMIVSISLFMLPLLMESSRPFYQSETYRLFYFSNHFDDFFREISQGELWRLVTPIFLHFGLIHLLFNMMWLKDLGKIFEYCHGKISFISFILSLALISNVAQYLVTGPMFGGMSGVVYGLLGYLWAMRTMCENFEFGLPQFDVYLMIGWFFLCLTGLVGPIANVAHGVGLSLGMMVGLGLCARKNLFKGAHYLALACFFSLLTIFVEFLRADGQFYFQRFTSL